MLPKFPQALLVVLLHAGVYVTAQRRGGWRGGGGGGGGSGDDDFDDYDDEEGDSGSSILPPPIPDPVPQCDMGRCACTMVDERTDQYELPGMYYNGTVTISHKLEDSSVWLFEDPERNPSEDYKWCGNHDSKIKTYEYPGLLFVGNTGNDSDTNPIFWILRGYQPANQTKYLDDDNEPYLDVRQRWIHLRSSDFVVKDESRKGLRGQYRYLETDATATYRQTSVYWRTNITEHSEDDLSFSARTTYDRQPLLTQESGQLPAADMTFWDPEKDHQDTRTSQYVTLSDVCDSLHQTVDGGPSAPRSLISEGGGHQLLRDVTTPTIWIPLGTVAEMSGIGSETAKFELKQEEWERLKPYVSGQSANCRDDFDQDKFEYSEFSHMYRFGQPDSIWNLTLSTLSLSFEGRLVQENSTEISSFGDDGVPVFGAEYKRAPKEDVEIPSESGDEEGGAMRVLTAHPLLVHLPSILVAIRGVHALRSI